MGPEYQASPEVNCEIIVRAILVTPDNTLNIAEYNAFLEEGEI